MASIIPNFEYDIFISYRHNDNLDGWVTEFVQSLEKELKSTIKDPLSVYFDKNPHDGLLETHNVDKSLEGKLKCLIFIPIISQTYCDTKSFAWQHEFCAFNKLSKEDQFGRDIKLSNRNVASRILPIKIHDLDEEDRTAIESEIGGVLRAIEFIYKEPGVNRPLKISDDRNTNLNKSDYRNQINKVANAIKEIVTSVSKPKQSLVGKVELTTGKKSKKVGVILFGLLVIAFIAGYYFFNSYSSITSRNEHDPILDKAEKWIDELNRFGDVRYSEQAFQAIQSVLAKDSTNARALYLMISLAIDADTSEYFIRRLNRSHPNSIYSKMARAGRLIEKSKWSEAKPLLESVLREEQKNRDALSMITFLHLADQDYINCYQYAKKLEVIDAKGAHDILASLYLELGDFKEAFHELEMKQTLQEFTCNDVESFQKILLCEGNFEKLEKLTDSLCNFSKCADCAFWQLRAKAHLGKYKEAQKWIGPSLKRAPKIAWRNIAFVLQKNGKADSAKLLANAEIEFDKKRLADSTYGQALPLYSLAAIYAMQGNAKESLHYLRQYASKRFEIGSEWYMAHDPLFDELQKDHEFFADFLQLYQKEQHRKTAIREQLRSFEDK